MTHSALFASNFRTCWAIKSVNIIRGIVQTINGGYARRQTPGIRDVCFLSFTLASDTAFETKNINSISGFGRRQAGWMALISMIYRLNLGQRKNKSLVSFMKSECSGAAPIIIQCRFVKTNIIVGIGLASRKVAGFAAPDDFLKVISYINKGVGWKLPAHELFALTTLSEWNTIARELSYHVSRPD